MYPLGVLLPPTCAGRTHLKCTCAGGYGEDMSPRSYAATMPVESVTSAPGRAEACTSGTRGGRQGAAGAPPLSQPL